MEVFLLLVVSGKITAGATPASAPAELWRGEDDKLTAQPVVIRREKNIKKIFFTLLFQEYSFREIHGGF